MMKLRKRNELLNDIIRHGKKHPTGWMASFKKNYHHFSNDSYLLHPKIGLFYLKEYKKNPFQQKGVGGKIARKIDDDITEELQKNTKDFGIIQGDIRKIAQNIKKGSSPNEIINAMFTGKNKGMTMPIRGKTVATKKEVEKIKDHNKENQQKIDKKFQKIAQEDGLYSSYD